MIEPTQRIVITLPLVQPFIASFAAFRSLVLALNEDLRCHVHLDVQVVKETVVEGGLAGEGHRVELDSEELLFFQLSVVVSAPGELGHFGAFLDVQAVDRVGSVNGHRVV